MVTQQPELAIDADGQPIDIPPEVVAWRVRRVKGPGRPGLVHDPMGRPITLPITASFQDLYDVAGAGKYIVDPIDEFGRICKEVTPGVTGMIQPQIAEDPEPSPGSSTRNASNPGNQDVVYALLDKLLQTVDAHTKIAELVVSRIPSMIESAAGLVTAADGAKLPARTPPPMPPEPPPLEYDEQPEAPTTPEDPWFRQVLSDGMKAFAATMAEKLGASISSIPLSALLDWSKAAPTAKPAAPAPQTPPAAPRPSWAPAPWSPSPPPRTPEPSWFAAGPPESPSWEPPPPVYSAPIPSAARVVAAPVVAEPMAPMPIGPVESAPPAMVPPPVASIPVAPAPVMSAPVASMPVASVVSAPVAPAPVMSAPAVSAPMEAPPMASVQLATAPVAAVPADPATGAVAMASSPAGGAVRDTGGHAASARRPDPTTMTPTGSPASKRRNDPTATASRPPPRPRTSMDDSVPVTAHVMQVYQALTGEERTYVQQLIGRLTQAEQAQWLMELASLPISDAVARVRDVIRPRMIPPSGGKNGAPS